MSVITTREMIWQEANDGKRRNADGILERLTRFVALNFRRNRTMAALHSLSDWQLRDIGLHRGDIARMVSELDDVDLGLTRPAPVSARVSA